jgi:hypothetical protein
MYTCKEIKETMLTKGKNILGLKQRKEAKDWITEETWEEINKRKTTKQKINHADDETKPTLLAQYADINKRVKRYARRDKRARANKLAHKAQLAAEGNNLKELYQITKRLAGKPIMPQQVGVKRSDRMPTYNPTKSTGQMARIVQGQFCNAASTSKHE